MTEANSTSIFTSPSSISASNELSEDISSILNEAEEGAEVRIDPTAIIGSICHGVLEKWNFHGASGDLQSLIESVTKWIVTVKGIKDKAMIQHQVDSFIHQPENSLKPFYDKERKGAPSKTPFCNIQQIQDTESMKSEALKILSKFIGSEAYKEIQGAHILGREVPILLRWNEQIMRGTIDILYKIGNRIIIGDYKTDHVKLDELPAKVSKYKHQRDVYVDAVKRCLQIDNPEFKLIFLRLGKAVSI